MKILRQSILILLIIIGVIRAVCYFGYAAAYLPSPLESYFLEAKMVLLAYRAEVGITLYPDWLHYPHVANFFGPVYFILVGLIGRLAHADIPGLFGIGRSVSFGAGLLTSLVVGMVIGRRYGSLTGMAGGIVSLGTMSMIGFSVMCRPDLCAELLATLGFFLASKSMPWTRVLGGAFLVLAMLTKQTTVVFLMASVLGWICVGQWRTGLLLGLGAALALGGVVGGVTWLVEPNFAGALLGESQTPWDLKSFHSTFTRVILKGIDSLYFPLVGIALWLTRATGRRDPRWAVLGILIVLFSVVTSAKRGADTNYYLSMRVVEGLAVGSLWHAWSISQSWFRSMLLATTALVGCLALALSTYSFYQQTSFAWRAAKVLNGSYGRGLVTINREMTALTADPQSRVLTDSGLFDLYARENAVFGDPWLFRMLTDTGRIDPVVLRNRIDAQYYDLVVTTSELHQPKYDFYEFGLPKTLADRVRARYVFSGTRGELFVYRRRPLAKPQSGSP